MPIDRPTVQNALRLYESLEIAILREAEALRLEGRPPMSAGAVALALQWIACEADDIARNAAA